MHLNFWNINNIVSKEIVPIYRPTNIVFLFSVPLMKMVIKIWRCDSISGENFI